MTAIDWFWDEIAEIIPFTVDTETGIALYEAYKKAKQMEQEQSNISQLSDEEIREAGIDNWDAESQSGLYVVAFQDGAKWYREQLKQRL